jgi:hypothetical protein
MQDVKYAHRYLICSLTGLLEFGTKDVQLVVEVEIQAK